LVTTPMSSSPRYCHLFLPYYAAPRDLHSFPTRRSSDLSEYRGRGAGAILHRMDLWVHRNGYSGGPQNDRGGIIRNPRIRDRKFRSEEHTSELQSRENLVCRLLLEKKKKKKK